MLWYFIFSAALVAIDQITKVLAAQYLADGNTIPIWKNVFELQYCENTGVAFSMLENQRWVFIPITVLVVVLMIIIMLRSSLCRSWQFSVSCSMILAGGIGNLIDRIFHGYVVDFLYFKLINFPIFNFADCCVTVGAVLLFVYLLFIYRETESLPLRTLLFGIQPKVNVKDDNTDE